MQTVIVIIIVAVCAWFTVRMLYRTFVGKSSNCGMCDCCDPAKTEKPSCRDPQPPKAE